MKKLLIMLLLLGPVTIVAIGDEHGLPASVFEDNTPIDNVIEADKKCNDMILKIKPQHSQEQLYFIYQKCIETLLDNKSKENNNPKQ